MAGFCAFLIKYVLADKDKQIERWQKVAEGNGIVANDSLALAKEEKELLLELTKEVREIRRAQQRRTTDR
jgi:hypothetical protein